MKLRNHYFLLRHGQTVYQTRKKEFIYPPLPENIAVKLLEKGRKQIKAAVRLLRKTKIGLILSSDFLRARQTAKIVAGTLGIDKIYFDKRLRDINLGIYCGGLKKDFYRKFPLYSESQFYKRPKKGENWRDCQKRVVNALKNIDKKYKGKTILIVSHGEPLWLLEGAVKNWSITKLLKERQNNFIKTGELRRLSV